MLFSIAVAEGLLVEHAAGFAVGQELTSVAAGEQGEDRGGREERCVSVSWP